MTGAVGCTRRLMSDDRILATFPIKRHRAKAPGTAFRSERCRDIRAYAYIAGTAMECRSAAAEPAATAALDPRKSSTNLRSTDQGFPSEGAFVGNKATVGIGT